MTYYTLADIPVDKRRVLLRADLNLPMYDGVLGDTTRLERLLPTLRYLLRSHGTVILLSHFGRPGGKPNPLYSLRPVAQRLEELLAHPVKFFSDCIGAEAERFVASHPPGSIIVMENLRFYEGEEANDPAFAASLARLGDVFINDAFSASHRAHASIVGLPQLLPHGMGLQMMDEVHALSSILEHPKRPLAAIVGGAKVSTKVDLLQNLVKKVDVLLLGGGMANTFLWARGIDVGASLKEEGALEVVHVIEAAAKAHNCRLELPLDARVVTDLRATTQGATCSLQDLHKDHKILDIGPETIKAYTRALQRCSSIIWNGPMGVFEEPPFNTGTKAIAQVVAQLTSQQGVLSVAGGGDTVAALKAVGCETSLTYLSTAGGAFLEWLEGKELPGLQALSKE